MLTQLQVAGLAACDEPVAACGLVVVVGGFPIPRKLEGIGPRPYVDCFEAPSPGLAELAAQDKFGRWIKVTDVKELPVKKLKLVKSTPKPRRTKQNRPLNVVSPWK